MAQGARRFDMLCPTEHEHVFKIPGAEPVTGIALGCPNCVSADGQSPAAELTEIVAIRRRTMAGVAELPAQARAELDASGTLAGLYRVTVTEVRDAAERCRRQFGADLPAALRAARANVADRAQVGAVLDAATDWAAGLPTH
jgi:hypothetical protein